MKRLLAILLVLCVRPAPAPATTPYPFVDYITMNYPGEVSVLVTPLGTGPPLNACYSEDGYLVDATITLRLVTLDYTPIANFPPEDIWLESQEPQQHICGSGFSPDGPSGADGLVTFSGPLAGGGWHDGPTYVYVNGNPAYDPTDYPWYWEHPPLPLHFNSPDIDGDGLVNLADLSLLASDFFGQFHYRSDFNHDGVLNLSDIGNFAINVGTGCP